MASSDAKTPGLAPSPLSSPLGLRTKMTLLVTLLLLSVYHLITIFAHSFWSRTPTSLNVSSTVPAPFSAAAWDRAADEASAFVAKLTIKEKISMLTGDPLHGMCVGNIAPIDRLNFTGMCFSDGPAGVNRGDLISVFPSGVTVAATWDRSLIYARGIAIGEEFRAKGMNVALGPVAGPLGRHARGGRNWEGFSPDPYLTGIAMAETVRGMQEKGVQASAKHWLGNEQETMRSLTDDGVDAISSNMADRVVHELYAWPFADAIRQGVASIMCAYNRVNGTYSCQNKRLLTEILRDELAFRGYVVSDWWATHSTEGSVDAGMDLEMPGVEPWYHPHDNYYGKHLLQAVKAGNVSEKTIDNMVTSVMTPYYLLGQSSPDFPTLDPSQAWVMAVQNLKDRGAGLEDMLGPVVEARDVRGSHAELIREIGAAGIVLLKNSDGTLPLKKLKNIGVFGNDAADPTDGLTYVNGWSGNPLGFETGTLDIGGGSGTARHTTIVSPLEAIRTKAKELGARVQYITNNAVIVSGDSRTIFPVPEVCLVFTKSFMSEGYDRPSLSLDWDGDAVVAAIASYCPNTVVVTHAGGVVTMPWASNPNVTAILAAHYPGEQTGNSIVDVLWGAVNPSGKLPYTIPKNASDYQPDIVSSPDKKSGDWVADFDEGLMIDYRYFDSADIDPLYEFGFGLSYTTFDVPEGAIMISRTYEDPHGLGKYANRTLGKEPGGWTDLWTVVALVCMRVRNTGHVEGAEVVQLYMSFPKGEEDEPRQVLRGFEKVTLGPGEATTVVFPLRRRDISIWDVTKQDWRVPKGKFKFRAGFSSRDIKAKVDATFL